MFGEAKRSSAMLFGEECIGKKTARELAAMVMREVRASGKCSDLQSVVVHPTGRNYVGVRHSGEQAGQSQLPTIGRL